MKNRVAALMLTLIFCFIFIKTPFMYTSAEKVYTNAVSDNCGGGYAASGQISGMDYTTKLYDASNGLPTSDAMFLLGASDGHMWIGGNSGVICYDGSTFSRQDTSDGMTNARGFFEDHLGRIWIATNDNGVVVIDGSKRFHLTYKNGLPSSSIRIFAEAPDGTVYIGTTTGICYADTDLKVHKISCEAIAKERVLKLDSDISGKIYGQTSNGIVFAIDDHAVTEIKRSDELGIKKITTLMADPLCSGKVYLGTDDGCLYYGAFGEHSSKMQRISIPELNGSVHWLNYDCGRVWVSSKSAAGYLDEDKRFNLLEHLPISSGIEMIDSDYQGNLWIASSTQGVLKIVASNFVDVSSRAGLPQEVTNAAIMYDDSLYLGTDTGLRIIAPDGTAVENELTEYIGTSRIRCFAEDKSGDLWIASYTNELGLICYSHDGSIHSLTTDNGMPHDQIRSIYVTKDGTVIAGTDGGVAFIQNGKVVRTVGSAEGMINTVTLCLAETDDGSIMAGTDGGGIYVIGQNEVSRLGRDDGLTSDIIMSITRDTERNVFWIVTSNSIEYLANDNITHVRSFPYNNNYSLELDNKGNAWVLSSYGVYIADVKEMLDDKITDYSLFTLENGLPYAITCNCFSAKDDEGNLYLAGRNGVIKVNMERIYERHTKLLTNISEIRCDNEKIAPDSDGIYHIPASQGRIEIAVSVMDYSLQNPMVHIFLEGGPDDGITVPRSQLTELEYTNLQHGEYKLHVQIVDRITGEILQDDVYRIQKSARISELVIVKILLIVLLAFLTGLGVWRFMHSTVIARQYADLNQAKEEAKRANTVRSRFLANISNELCTPINTIMGMNEMAMREDAANVPRSYFMSMMNYAFDIRFASESLMGLIEELLDMSRIESGDMKLNEQDYDIQELLRSVIALIRYRSKQKGLTFDVSVDEMLPRCFYGDIGKLKQIILNLLTNAVKYTNEGGLTLTVSMEERRGDTAILSISVADTGIGIKEDNIEKIFTAYQLLDDEKNNGAGLGLNISRKFAELMDGSIQCKSVYQQGSEFILTLPQRIVVPEPVGVFSETVEASSKGLYIPLFTAPDADILVVDDNKSNLALMKGLLKQTRVFVTTSENGEDALDKIQDSHFDVVFLNVLIKGRDDSELIDRIRELDPELPVYAMTANSAGEDFYIQKGFTGCLVKPINGAELENMILRHLPEEIVEKSNQYDPNAAITELPNELQWLYDIPEMSVADGIKSAGGIGSYIFSIQLFYDTIGSYSSVIRSAFESGNIKLYAVKVHALRVSSHIIGAKALSELASSLETAAEKQDWDYVKAHTDKLLRDYVAFSDKLSGLGTSNKAAKEGRVQ